MSLKGGKGLFKGDSHAEGGIPSEVVETGQLLEIEGDEYYICRDAYTSSEVYELKGKTNQEALNFIYTKFSCKLVQSKMHAGDFIICKVVVRDKKKHDRKGTIKEIVNQMQAEKSCKVEDSRNIKLQEGGGISTQIQTLILDKDRFENEKQAEDWVKENDFKSTKIDEKENTYRFRQENPDKFTDSSFRTITLSRGVKAVIAKPIMAKGGGVEDPRIKVRSMSDHQVIREKHRIVSEDPDSNVSEKQATPSEIKEARRFLVEHYSLTKKAKGGSVNVWHKGDVTVVNGEYLQKAEIVSSKIVDGLSGEYGVFFKKGKSGIKSMKDGFKTYNEALEYAKNNVNDDSNFSKGGGVESDFAKIVSVEDHEYCNAHDEWKITKYYRIQTKDKNIGASGDGTFSVEGKVKATLVVKALNLGASFLQVFSNKDSTKELKRIIKTESEKKTNSMKKGGEMNPELEALAARMIKANKEGASSEEYQKITDDFNNSEYKPMGSGYERGDLVVFHRSGSVWDGDTFRVYDPTIVDGEILIIDPSIIANHHSYAFKVQLTDIVGTTGGVWGTPWGSESKPIDYSTYSSMDDIEINGRTGFVLSNDVEKKEITVEFDDNDEMETISYADVKEGGGTIEAKTSYFKGGLSFLNW